jgi:hypothetical protein
LLLDPIDALVVDSRPSCNGKANACAHEIRQDAQTERIEIPIRTLRGTIAIAQHVATG